jgi:glycosyltransferase involved in cell wall biosynthesis
VTGSGTGRRVSVVIPCKNEALNLPSVLGRLGPEVTEVVVVDSNCEDDTVAVARRLRPDVVIVSSREPGKGRALRAGMSAATGDVIVTLDGDGSNDPGEIPAMLAALDSGAGFVKGSRYLPGGGSADSTPMRDAGSRLICGVFNRLHGTRHTDLLYGYMAFRATDRDAVLPDCEGFEVEAYINANAAGAGLVVAEVPSVEARRLHGESHLHPFRDGVRILRTIVRERPRHGARA